MTSYKTAGLLGAVLAMPAAMMAITPAEAQSSATELPTVRVEAPSRPTTRPRRAVRRQPRVNNKPARTGGNRRSRCDGRAFRDGYRSRARLSREPERHRHQDRHPAARDAAVDHGGHRRSHHRSGRTHRAGVAPLRAWRVRRCLWPGFARRLSAYSRPGSQRLSRRHPRGEQLGLQRMAARSLHAGAHRGAARPVIGALRRHFDGRLAEPDLEASAGKGIARSRRAIWQLRSQATAVRQHRQADEGWRVAVSLHRRAPRQRYADRLRQGQSHRAGAIGDLATDDQHQLDRARDLSEGQDRILDRIPAA